MTITLLHPSRSRANKSKNTVNKWLLKSSGKYPIQVIVSLDQSDISVLDYEMVYADLHEQAIGSLRALVKNTITFRYNESNKFGIVCGPNDSVVSATNRAAEYSKGDILIYLSDDFDCPHNWDELVVNEFDNLELPRLLKVDDCLQKFNVPVLTIPIMNRALYNKLGYFWHPEYKSMFVDCDLYEVCARNGFIREAPYLKFPHLHHSIGHCGNDETYRRSEANWNQGQAIFNRRKRENFPI